MNIRFHQILAFFIVTLFLDIEYDTAILRVRPIDFFLAFVLMFKILESINLKILKSTVAIGLYIFLGFIIINGFTKVASANVIKEGIQLLEYLFLLHLIAFEINNQEKRSEFLIILFWGSGLVAFYSVAYHASLGIYSGYKDLDSPKHSFAFFSLLALIRYFTQVSRKSSNFFILMASLLITFLGGERKGWLGLFLASSVFLLVQTKSKQKFRRITSIVATFIFVVFILVSYIATNTNFQYLNKQIGTIADVEVFFSDKDNVYASRSDAERIFMFNYSIQLFDKNPLLGIGVDEFSVYVKKATFGEITHDAHNFYLKELVENGIIGLTLLLIAMFIITVNIAKLTKNKDEAIADSAKIILALFVLGSIVNLFLAGKALTWLYLILPAGLIIGLNKEVEFQKRVTKHAAVSFNN